MVVKFEANDRVGELIKAKFYCRPTTQFCIRYCNSSAKYLAAIHRYN